MNAVIKKVTGTMLAFIIGFTAVAAPAYADDHDNDMDDPENIVEIASGSEDLETLVAVVGAAGLVDALSAPGQLTVFAPVDDAFSALGVGTINELLEPANIEKLTSILTYHVANGKILSTNLSDGMVIPTLNGQKLEVSIDGDTVMINDATVIAANIMASNGVVHLIDSILMPEMEMEDKIEEEKPSIVGIATSDENFSSLVAAVSSRGLVEILDTGGPFTVFAPTNEAFADLPFFVTEALERNPDLLTDILLYHVIDGTVLSTDLKRHQKVDSLEGSKLSIRSMSDSITVDRATVTAADINVSNGVVHVIDTVLIPRSLILDELKRVQMELQTMLSELRTR